MPHGGPHNDGFSYSIDPDLEGDFMGQYGQALGQFTLEAPQLLERSAARERQALQQAQRTGMMSLAEQAAQSRAAAMGGAGQMAGMAGGGGRAASLRQGGLSFGRRAADFAADAAQRAAGLEADITSRRMQMMGETIPGALLAQGEAGRQSQNDFMNVVNQIEVLESNTKGLFSTDRDERARVAGNLLSTLTPGTPAFNYVYQKIGGYGDLGMRIKSRIDAGLPAFEALA